ncbi:MAG: trigger factor, partial [bacterium]
MGVRVPPLADAASPRTGHTASVCLQNLRGQDLRISVEQIKPWKVVLKVRSDPAPVEREMERLYSEYTSEVEIPGFRKGKAPRELVKARYGKAIESEAVEKAIPSVYRQAIEEKRMNPITQAEIDEVSFEGGKELCFKATFEVVPEFEVTGYEGLPISNKTAEPSKEEIEERIEVLRRMNASLAPVVREARTGDHLVVDYVVLDEKKKPVQDASVSNYSLPLGEIGQKELDEGLLGVKAGDVREVMVSFPPEATDRRVAGKRLPVRMKIREVKEPRIPELNEDFAKD